MTTRVTALLVGAPLLVVGWFSAHEAGYRLVAPEAHARADLLARSGHGYLAWAPALVGLCAALVLAGFAGRVRARSRAGRDGGAPSARLAAVAPLVGFAVQEQAERLVHTGHLSLDVFAEPAFIVGLALQVPFALLALLVRALFLGAADALGGLLARPARPRTGASPAGPGPPPQPRARLRPLAVGRAGRAPPLPALG